MSEKRIDGFVMIAFALGVILTFAYCTHSLAKTLERARERRWPDEEGGPDAERE